MKMKKFLLIIVLLLPLASLVFAEESEEEATDSGLYFSGDVWSNADYYFSGEGEFNVGAFLSLEKELSSEWTGAVSVQTGAGSIERNGADIFTRDGERPIVSLREAYVSSESWRIGKQVLADEMSVKFDFVSFNLLETRDLSRPFSSLDSDRLLGNWGVAKSFFDGRLKVIASLSDPPTIATDDDDPWTRELPQGFSYGEIRSEAEYSVGARWGDDIGNAKYDVYIQHGAGSSLVDVEASPEGEVRPIVAQQTAVSGMVQKPLGEWNLRLGSAGYFQSGYSDFVVAVAELERFWEFDNGSVFFFDFGLADTWETQSDDDMPELDLRRIYEGGTILAAAEYSFDHSALKLKGAYNVKDEGLYFSAEFSWAVTDSVDLSLKYEAIDGEASKASPADNAWSQYSDCDRIVAGLTFYF